MRRAGERRFRISSRTSLRNQNGLKLDEYLGIYSFGKDKKNVCCLVFNLQSAAKQTVDIAADRRTERSFRRKHRPPKVDRRGDDAASAGESKLVSNLY